MDSIGILKYFEFNGVVAKDLVATTPEKRNVELITLTDLDREFDYQVDNGASEFSITFQEKYRRKYTDKQIRKMLSTQLRFMTNKCRYILYPEYGGNANLHYHGIIWGEKCKMEMSKIRQYCVKNVGRTYIRMISYSESYKNYVRKERKDMELEDICKMVIHKYPL